LTTLGNIVVTAVEPAASLDFALAQVCEGDRAALGQIYDQHHTAVRMLARRLLGAEAAEDLVHDTFLSLPKALRRWNGQGALRSFILGVAVNHARHHVRGAVRRRLAMARYADEPQSSPRSQEEASEQRRLAALLMQALDQLSFQHRATFVLCEVEERASPEVAQILGIPEATVRTRLHHARQKLRAALQKAGVR